MKIKIVANSKWARHGWLGKRLHGFFSYQIASFFALVLPVQTDVAMFSVLSEQFNKIKSDEIE
jgi:hypothetical protein